MSDPILLSTAASRYFAEGILERLRTTPSYRYSRMAETERTAFDDGERRFRIGIDNDGELNGRDVIMVASTAIDRDLLEMMRVGMSAVAEYGARRLIYAIPFLGYSTMERAVMPGEVVTAKCIIRQLSQLPSGDMPNQFLLMDLHKSGLLHYFEGNCRRRELYAQPVLVAAIKALGLSDMVFGSADLGCLKWVAAYARHFDASIVPVRKTRTGKKVETHEVIGDVRDRNVVIYDDMIRTGGSVIGAAKAYLANGAKSVSVVTSHWAVTEKGFHDLIMSPVERFIATNTHPASRQIGIAPKVTILDVSRIFVGAIEKLLA